MLRYLVLIAVLRLRAVAGSLNPLEHAGANSPWFPGPNVFKIDSSAPAGCEIDQAVYVVRHGSRYPDPSAYQQWQDMHTKFSAAKFTASSTLSFLPNWSPVPADPVLQLAQESITGWEELYDLGITLRFRYPQFRPLDNTSFTVWANDFPRVVDTARIFSRGYLGPNSALGNVLVINSTSPAAVLNSLAPSDSCPNFHDSSGAAQTAIWDAITLPPVTARLQKLIHGNLILDDSDVSLFPYLCGFESQITGRTSPFCEVFEDRELINYEYHQDLRYWYGTGGGSSSGQLERDTMLPLLSAVVELLVGGPGKSYVGSKGTSFIPPPLVMAFTHDNQLMELTSASGIFDTQKNLTTDHIPADRTFISSRTVPMRGTLAFERLSCGKKGKKAQNKKFVRLILNDAVYPIPSCKNGPGSSCLLEDYSRLVAQKASIAGNLAQRCGITPASTSSASGGKTTFFVDPDLPSIRVVKP